MEKIKSDLHQKIEVFEDFKIRKIADLKSNIEYYQKRIKDLEMELQQWN